MVVQHDSVLRETTLYTFEMVDNTGRNHRVQAYGIDQITDDSRTLDISGVQSKYS